MGSGFGFDGIGSIRNNLGLRKKRSPFAGRGEVPDHRIMQFTPKARLSAKQLKKLGLAQRRSENQRGFKALMLTLTLAGILILISYLYFN